MGSGGSWGQKSWSKGVWSGVEGVQAGSRGLGSERMELDSEGFKSEVGVEVVREVGGLGSKRLELGWEEFVSRDWVGIREVGGVGVGGGVRVVAVGGVRSEGVGVGGLGIGKLGSGELGSGGTWGRKSRDQGG